MRQIVRLKPDGTFELDLHYFRHHIAAAVVPMGRTAPPIGDLFSPALEELLGPRRAAGRSARGPPSRHRALGAGDVRGGILSSDRRLAEALRADRSRARRRLRDELGRQRQGPPDDAVSAGLCAVGGGRCRRRDRRGVRGLAQARRRRDPSSWITPIGGRSSTIGRSPSLIAARDARLDAAGCTSRRCRRRGRTLPAHGGGDRRRQGRRLVSGAHGMGPARARQPLDPLRSAPRRHEGHPQRQDQAARIASARLRPRSSKRRWPNGSRRTTTSPS